MQASNRDRVIWDDNASTWDSRMGNESNEFHREIVRPPTEEHLSIEEEDFVLDIACGNGNFSRRLAEQGARVVAFDFSKEMIELAKRRQSDYLTQISFNICDATSLDEIMSLKQNVPFDKAVSNMALMDIADIRPLFEGVYEVLKPGGIFVFSTHHPCFTAPNGTYRAVHVHQGKALEAQPMIQNYYHRSIQDILEYAFDAGFIVDGFKEGYEKDSETPIIIIVRLRKSDG